MPLPAAWFSDICGDDAYVLHLKNAIGNKERENIMDFTRNGGSVGGNKPVAQSAHPATSDATNKDRRSGRKLFFNKWIQIGLMVILVASTALIAATAFLIASNNGNESKYVDGTKYQAVFLNGNSGSAQSVYFGHITALTDQYIVLQDIYYLTTSSTSSSSSTTSNNYSLTKLGCQQLHDPYDQMIINMNQVAFWENLQNSGKVVTAITQYQKQNPNGPNCNQSSSSVGTSNTSTQSNTTPSASTSHTTTQSNTTSNSPAPTTKP